MYRYIYVCVFMSVDDKYYIDMPKYKINRNVCLKITLNLVDALGKL